MEREYACMEQVRGGDRSAVRELFDHTSPKILRLLTTMLGERESAEDVMVDVYAEAWRRRARFDGSRCSPLGWLMVLARSRAIDQLRRVGRERHVVEPREDWFTDQPSGLESGADRAERRELRVRLRSALRAVPRDQRNLVVLAFFGEMSHSEIAAAESLPLGTVKSRIRAALSHLRGTLVDGDEADGDDLVPRPQ